jgi:nitroimidazol reductase NimA-like FMN-containing flavoprotein (pyridoxamine 5'-phosphate oxidase superfamily)
MEIGRDGLEVLDRAECLRLLNRAAVGRIAGTSGALPVVLPVGYALDGESIVFETCRGTTLDFVTSGSVVAFEVDNLNEGGPADWIVMVTGVAKEVRDSREVERLRGLLHEDGSDHDECFVRISSELCSGRRTDRPHRNQFPGRALPGGGTIVTGRSA